MARIVKSSGYYHLSERPRLSAELGVAPIVAAAAIAAAKEVLESEEFQDILEGVMDGIGDAIDWVVQGFKDWIGPWHERRIEYGKRFNAKAKSIQAQMLASYQAGDLGMARIYALTQIAFLSVEGPREEGGKRVPIAHWVGAVNAPLFMEAAFAVLDEVQGGSVAPVAKPKPTPTLLERPPYEDIMAAVMDIVEDQVPVLYAQRRWVAIVKVTGQALGLIDIGRSMPNLGEPNPAHRVRVAQTYDKLYDRALSQNRIAALRAGVSPSAGSTAGGGGGALLVPAAAGAALLFAFA